MYQKFSLKHRSTAPNSEADPSEELETDVMENLTQHAGSERYLKRFYNDHMGTFKTELLQTIRLFEHDLAGSDPFYIECESPP